MLQKLDMFPVLDNGHITYLDHMGGDSAIANDARVSYKGLDATLTEEEYTKDESLIRTLMRDSHCYHPEMEVLTSRGWIKWSNCSEEEIFAVPNPDNKTISFEKCKVLTFSHSGEMITFKNDRMSYSVTPNHRMWFATKQKKKFCIVTADKMANWGHFEPSSNYSVPATILGSEFREACFIGFYLGDGCCCSKNRITFHLKKHRKQAYLESLLLSLDLKYKKRESSTHDDAYVYSVETPEFLRKSLSGKLGSRCCDKGIPIENWALNSYEWCYGMASGLSNSDGHRKKDRNQESFHSTSPGLIDLKQAVDSVIGIDCHRVSIRCHGYTVNSYHGKRTTLESRAQYLSKKSYNGQVMCATTSTGLLLVRGNSDEFGFVCGNSSPFEQSLIKWGMKIPMDVWRQFVRHRTFKYMHPNEYSTRYKPANDDMLVASGWRTQHKDNKQGSGAPITDEQIIADLTIGEQNLHDLAREVYQHRLDVGVAREQARKDLPLSTYTEITITGDVWNLMHFFMLRRKPDAQLEIREVANCLYKNIFKPLFPATAQAFEDYRFNAISLSAIEIAVLSGRMQLEDIKSKREQDELLRKSEMIGAKL